MSAPKRKITSQKVLNASELDALIKAGQVSEARQALQDLNRNTLNTDELVKYAGLANRVYEPKLAYRFLHSLVREPAANRPASNLEKIEFAEALRGMGLIPEAVNLLKEVDARTHPVVFLRLSFCQMTSWQYSEAIANLKNFIQASDPSDYASTIAKVNLVAAYLSEKMYLEAEPLLEELRIETEKKGHRLLFGNCLELTAQLYVLKGKFERAEEIFQQAKNTFEKEQSRYSNYLRKWQAISKSLQHNQVSSELIECQARALEDSDWETIRDCDFYMGYLTRNENLIQQVYFGTPYDSYRRRILDLVGAKFPLPDQFIWKDKSSEELKRILNLSTGDFEGEAQSIETGQLLHRLLIVLCMDFYRPLTVGRLFSELFPEEHFLQTGSTNRISQLLLRLREWSLAHGQPFAIIEKESAYRLQLAPGIGIRISKEKRKLSGPELNWEKFEKQLLGQEFYTRNDVIQLMQSSATSASRLITWALENNRCEQVGNGRQRKYRFRR